jgi:hypothetical protein
MWNILLSLLVLVIAWIIYYWYSTTPKNLPPGPVGLPLLGSALDYLNGPSQYIVLKENVKKYGPLFKLYIMNKLVLVLGNYEMIQEALVKQGDIFSGRPQFGSIASEKYKRYGESQYYCAQVSARHGYCLYTLHEQEFCSTLSG